MVVRACFSIMRRAGVDAGTPLQVIGVTVFFVFPVLVACSTLTYYVVELPFLALRQPYTTDFRR